MQFNERTISYAILVILVSIPPILLLFFALSVERETARDMSTLHNELVDLKDTIVSPEAKTIYDKFINYLDRITLYPIWRTTIVVGIVIGLFTFAFTVLVKDAFVVATIMAIVSTLLIVFRTNFYTFHVVQNSAWP